MICENQTLKYFIDNKFQVCRKLYFYYSVCSQLLAKYSAGNKIEKNEMGGACGTYRGEVCTRFMWGNLRERDHWGDQDVDGRIILGWIFRKWEGVVGTGCSWLRIGTGGGRL